MVEYLPVFPTRIRIAMVSVSSHVKLEFDFKTFLNKECTAKEIEKIRSAIMHNIFLNGTLK